MNQVNYENGNKINPMKREQNMEKEGLFYRQERENITTIVSSWLLVHEQFLWKRIRITG
jgi:hypothetical protein